ncbi:pilus assembly protein N-terminal domain-containing protein [Consotaella salsifontis]|uniref:Pilus formation protein N terminal region n=1 Tax=Consotaella salsifontis TaxID=1365950 RepID=A0A1T4S0U0_9HYPH|nr:pilus assembly protein N-terminal domain-containing protein [Consotaella salsifontis]SKA21853.1 Pilus formation protein N terminal region [Consotaella salsifontis]
MPVFPSARLLASAAFALAAIVAAPAARAETDPMLEVIVDHARVLKIDRPAATVIVGNPAIVDVTVHDSETLVLTGRSYGITNLIILDDAGQSIMDESVVVQTFENKTVRIYRQAERVTYACAPECEPTVTIGDETSAFARATSQFKTRQEMALGAAK